MADATLASGNGQTTKNRSVSVTLASDSDSIPQDAPGYEDGIGERALVEQRNAYQNITAAAPTTTVIKAGPGLLHAIVFNKPVATGVVTIYDNTAGSGTIIGTITMPANPLPFTLPYDVAFSTGLTIVTATAAQDITVSYR